MFNIIQSFIIKTNFSTTKSRIQSLEPVELDYVKL